MKYLSFIIALISAVSFAQEDPVKKDTTQIHYMIIEGDSIFPLKQQNEIKGRLWAKLMCLILSKSALNVVNMSTCCSERKTLKVKLNYAWRVAYIGKICLCLDCHGVLKERQTPSVFSQESSKTKLPLQMNYIIMCFKLQGNCLTNVQWVEILSSSVEKRSFFPGIP